MKKLFITPNQISELANAMISSPEIHLLHVAIDESDIKKTEEHLERDNDVFIYIIFISENIGNYHLKIISKNANTLYYLGLKLGAK